MRSSSMWISLPCCASMTEPTRVTIHWPDGRMATAQAGDSWLEAAARAGQTIPTACRVGSCGACEIDVNGVVIRACVAAVPACPGRTLTVSQASDPFW